jgi:formamidopyrimidine-DNA glycosylase
MRLVFGDGVNLRWWAPGQDLPQRHQLLLGFDDGSSLTGTVQMYGGLWAFREGEIDNPYIQTALEKPDPLAIRLTPATLAPFGLRKMKSCR